VAKDGSANNIDSQKKATDSDVTGSPKGDKNPEMLSHGSQGDSQFLTDLLRANTELQQMQYEASSHSNVAPGTPPKHLLKQNDAAQLPIDEQLQRTQELAQKNLKALLEGLRAACTNGPC
jgi:hypothetical protein